MTDLATGVPIEAIPMLMLVGISAIIVLSLVGILLNSGLYCRLRAWFSGKLSMIRRRIRDSEISHHEPDRTPMVEDTLALCFVLLIIFNAVGWLLILMEMGL